MRVQVELDGGGPARLDSAITLSGVYVAYNEQVVPDNRSLEISADSLTTISGSSGSGKTTQIDLITALVRPQRGKVLVGEHLDKETKH